MSQVLIQQYLRQLATLRKVGGTSRESVVREAFKDACSFQGGDVQQAKAALVVLELAPPHDPVFCSRT